ncbi:MAG: hypothetical protein HYS07_07075 [Chlamydiae bacterium]|nr:hypothetical protein [Chlamydiota bacterium]MBI3276905.1 hypothetical protein [Chlamydiota bacterium]
MKTLKFSKAFSVIEILFTLSIILILASLLMSSLHSVHAKARQGKCINNQYQLAKALLMFAVDYEKFPTTLGYLDQRYLSPDSEDLTLEAAETTFTSVYYDNVLALKRCPEVELNNPSANSYGLNIYITNQNLTAVPNPSETVLTADSDVLYIESADQAAKRHAGGTISSFADGHVEWLRELKPITALTTPSEPVPEPESTPPPPAPTPVFSLNNGTVVLNQDASSHVTILSVPIADQGQSNWFEVYVDLLVTLPGGEQIVYNLLHNEHGVTGAMNRSQLEGFSWDSSVLEQDSRIDMRGTTKSWSKETQTTGNGKSQKSQVVWTSQINAQYDSQNNFESQVWVLKNGDVVPTIPGSWNQISINQQVAPYVQTGSDGLEHINIGDNQVIYFFELGETSPYNADGTVNSNYSINDLVVLMDVNTV